jgi:beta-aspartyl-peptidase (threonine type)
MGATSRVVSAFLGELGAKAVVVHGGAGAWRDGVDLEAVERALRRAVEAGLKSSSPLSAVEEAIAVLEDSGVFNAGLGSTLTVEGRVEMDAGLMDGSGRAGGVGAVTYPRNPIRLARLVLEKTPHVLIVGGAADDLARRFGLEKHPGPSPAAIRRWRRVLEQVRRGQGPYWARAVAETYGLPVADTVGAVASVAGRTAAGTSTGGIVFKAPGRVGDSAIPGAGFYAVDGVGACAATGIGETIILGRPCVRALELIALGVPVEDAAKAAVSAHTERFGADNLGLIVVDARGRAAAAINTAAMPIGFGGDSVKPQSMMLSREG